MKTYTPGLAIGLLCCFALFTGNTAKAEKSDSELAAAIRGHACSGAIGGDYNKFALGMEHNGLKIPNHNIYGRIECPDSKNILQSTLIPRTTIFLIKFVNAVYHEHGVEEVLKIVNMRSRLTRFTLLEDAIAYAGCDLSTSTDNHAQIDYLRNIGAYIRPDFLSICKQDYRYKGSQGKNLELIWKNYFQQ
jgi:hypothetical protein